MDISSNSLKNPAGVAVAIAMDGDLTEGDPVIIRGAERLSDGQTVKVIRHHLART